MRSRCIPPLYVCSDRPTTRGLNRCVVAIVSFFLSAISSISGYAESLPEGTKKLQEYKSEFLVVFTDLPPDEARECMVRLERTLSHAAKYWGQPPRGRIECYILHDMDRLSDVELPHRLARVLVGGVGGATLPNLSRSGNRTRNQPTVVASSCPGVAEHEVVHAYCTQTFGYTGPDWYSEGMAEMVVLGCTRQSGVLCNAEQLRTLRDSHVRSIEEILSGGKSGSQLFESLNSMLAHPKNRDRQVPITDWRQEDTERVLEARRDYLRSWALCYMLLHNPNYSARFRILGQKHVTKNRDEFASIFASMEKEIAFEYGFFLRHVDVGYRVDLCSWDWGRKFRPLGSGETVMTRIDAKRGFQATGLEVVAGHRYRVTTRGEWSTGPNRSTELNPGSESSRGGIVGAIWNNYQLSQPFEINPRMTLRPPVSGQLYIRCQDGWNELHDNEGQQQVSLQRL